MIKHAIEFASHDEYPDLFPLLNSVLKSPKILSFLRIAALEERNFAEVFRLRKSDSPNKHVRTYLENILEGFIGPGKSNGRCSLHKELKGRCYDADLYRFL